MTIVSIHQPIYLPWLAYFDKIRRSDVHVVLDHVTVGKQDLCNRNKIRTAKGWDWITIPIKNKGSRSTPIKDIEIVEGVCWQQKHLGMIQQNYRNSPLWNKHKLFFDILYEAVCAEQKRLYPILAFLHGYLCEEFGIYGDKLCSSSRMNPQGAKSDMNLDICKKLGATVYLSGPFGRNYLDIKSFNDAGIEVQFTDFKHPEYKQCQPGPFIPGMSAIDAMLNGFRFE